MAAPSLSPPASASGAPASGPSVSGPATPGASYRSAFVVVTTLFFMWGLITSLNDVLIPHLKNVFTLTYVQAALVQFAFFSAYFIMAIPSERAVTRLGYQKTMVAGLLLAMVGALGFFPAAATASYPLFLGALFVLATGIVFLQTSANPYVTALGPPEGASSRLNLTQAFNSLGTTLGPVLGGALFFTGAAKTAAEMEAMDAGALAAYRASEAQSVQWPYVGLAALLGLIALLIWRSRLPRLAHVEDGAAGTTYAQALGVRHLFYGIVAIFLYVGAEVSIGSFLVNFFGLPEIAGLGEAEATRYVSMYWGAAMVGRFAGAGLMQRLRPGRVLMVAAVVAALLCAVGALASGRVAMFGVIAIGLFNSVMFPTIFALAVDRLGPLTGKGSGLLVMAIVGGAILPLAMGALIDGPGMQPAFLLPLACYLYIAWYGAKGHAA